MICVSFYYIMKILVDFYFIFLLHFQFWPYPSAQLGPKFMKENGLKYVTFSTAKGAPEVALAVKNAFFLYDLHISLFLFAIFIFLYLELNCCCPLR